MINFAICDDEPYMAEEISAKLCAYMKEKPFIPYRVETFPDSSSLLGSCCDFDLIFLDIQMKEPDGMETARILRQRNYHGLLIFVTILKECVFDAFEVQASDYLLKPLDGEHFCRTMDRAVQSLAQQKSSSIVIKKGNSCEVVRMSEIVYCEVQGRKIYIHQSGGKVTDCYEKLEDFGERLDSRFFRCHRSFIVNLGCISGCGAGQITLSTRGSIPVSRLRERDLRQALLRYMKGRKF